MPSFQDLYLDHVAASFDKQLYVLCYESKDLMGAAAVEYLDGSV